MKLQEDTQSILDEIEQVSGIPVKLIPDPSLPTLARMTRSRSGAPAHILTFKPDSPGLNYVVAYQAAFTLRFYETKERFDFGATDSGRAEVKRMVTAPDGVVTRMRLPPPVAEQITDQFFDGLMTQLRSIPVGMRIDSWIARECPHLRAEQRASIDAQQRTNVQSLSPQIRAMAPPIVFNANAAMNAAYAKFSDRLLENPIYSIPYRSVGFLSRGEQLLKIFDDLAAGAEHDKALVDAWANELGVSDWVAWVPVTAV
jgi:hypothetical protein